MIFKLTKSQYYKDKYMYKCSICQQYVMKFMSGRVIMNIPGSKVQFTTIDKIYHNKLDQISQNVTSH